MRYTLCLTIPLKHMMFRNDDTEVHSYTTVPEVPRAEGRLGVPLGLAQWSFCWGGVLVTIRLL
jgi:hypothetical protein